MSLLETRQITKTYGKQTVLNEVSVHINQGTIHGLLGPNGAGKTTLIRIINQIISSDSGEVLFNGNKMTRNDLLSIGYLPEERGLYAKMKVGEHLMYMAQLRGMKPGRAKEVIRKYLHEFEIGTWWYKKIEQLSKGMQQKIQFIISIMHDPKLVILDEPFTGFDPVNAELIKNKILELKANGTTFIVSTHRMESVEELCDYITLINKSNLIIEGKKTEIKEKYKANTWEIGLKGKIYSSEIENLPVKNVRISDQDDATSSLVLSFDPGYGINDLLGVLIKKHTISSVQEVIPSMNEIFIRLVQQKETISHE